jgi:hypothetical protein
MKMQDVRDKAKEMGVKTGGKKADVIRRIQEAEGNEICFGTRNECAEMACCWREDCVPGQ